MEKILKKITNSGFDHDAAINDLDIKRKLFQEAGDNTNANLYWCYIEVLRIHQAHVCVFNLLKNDNYYEAWCKLEQIEIMCERLLRIDKEAQKLIEGIPQTVQRLQKLYPYKLFFSTVIRIKEKSCSICGKQRHPRNHCGHYVGKLYNGEICEDIINCPELVGADIVANPEHKYSVPFMIDENGNRIDTYDYRLLKYLMSTWNHPYIFWHYAITESFVSHSEYPYLSSNDLCPCGSMKKYMDCCKDNSRGIKSLLYTFAPGLKEEN